MKYVFNDDGSKLDTSKIKFLSDKGSEFKVYTYLDSVIKLYKKNYNLPHMSLDELNTLKNIQTRRILLPTGTLWNNKHKLIGYKMPFISDERSIQNDNLNNLFEEMEILKQDLDLLCNNFIILMDINTSNTIYNGHLYLIDPGNYLINELDKIIFRINIDDPSIVEKLNQIIMKGDYSKVKFLTDSLSLEERKHFINLWNYNKINELFDQLIFLGKDNIDFFKFRQIVQFIKRERYKNGFIYNLDVFKKKFNKNLSVSDAVDEFVERNIKDDSIEKKLYMSLYNK